MPMEESAPLPEEPPKREEFGERVFDIPEEPPVVLREMPQAPKPAIRAEKPAPAPVPAAVPAAVDGNWWRALSENCKNRIPPMYRSFLNMASGVLEGDQLIVYVQDDITMNRLDNDRVRNVLKEEAERAAGIPVRVMLRVGEAPKATPQENLKNLLHFGSQFDNIEIK